MLDNIMFSTSDFRPQTSDFRYQWLKNSSPVPGATSSFYYAVSAGNFQLLVTNEQLKCSSISKPVNVQKQPEPVIGLEVFCNECHKSPGKVYVCRGNYVTFQASNITPQTSIHSFQWRCNGTNIEGAVNSSYTALQPGIYDLQLITQDNCSLISDADTLIVYQPVPPTIIPEGPASFCSGDSVLLISDLRPPTSDFRYQWKKNNTDLLGATNFSFMAISAGAYSVMITDSNGCTAVSQPLSINVFSQPPADISPSNDTAIYSGTSLLLKANKGNGYKYQWYRNNKIIAGAVMSSFSVASDGEYKVLVTNSNSCSAFSLTVKVTVLPVYRISGRVYYDNSLKTPLANVTLFLMNSENLTVDSARTDINGHFSFSSIRNGIYTLRASTLKEWGGGNPVDALLVNRYFINSYTFRDGLSKMSADVNNDKRFNPIDALTINRRYIHAVNSFITGDWLFEDTAIMVSNSDIELFIIAICFGDVNGSYIPPQ
jgi:hypothetical protein